MPNDHEKSNINGRLRPRKSIATNVQPTNKTKRKQPSTDKDSGSDPIEDSKSFLCLFCDKSFSFNRSLSKHLQRLHAPLFKSNSSIKCDYCDHNETSSADILTHLTKEHSDVYFACLRCRIRFTSNSDLCSHLEKECNKEKLTPRKHNKNWKEQRNEKDSNEEAKVIENKVNVFCTVPSLINLGLGISKAQQSNEIVDFEDSIATNIILPSGKRGDDLNLSKNAVIILSDIQRMQNSNEKLLMPPKNNSEQKSGPTQNRQNGETSRREYVKYMDEPRFERCYDAMFYSNVTSNVNENITLYLDGSFNRNFKQDNYIKTRRGRNNALNNTIDGFPTLLSQKQYQQSSYDIHTRGFMIKKKWKWVYPDKEISSTDISTWKYSLHLRKCIIGLLSRLDIVTQLTMRSKFDSISTDVLPVNKSFQNDVSLSDRDLKINENSIKCFPQLLPPDKADDKQANYSNLPFMLGLELVSKQSSVEVSVLSGECVRRRCFVCSACGVKADDRRHLAAHHAANHPNAQLTQYEIVGEELLKADIVKHLYIPPGLEVSRNRPTRGARSCTKCDKLFSYDYFHHHLLECAGDNKTVRRKCRYKLFNVRKRRVRLPDNTIRKKIREQMLRPRKKNKNALKKKKLKTHRGDAETIRKMIADLPSKRYRKTFTYSNQTTCKRLKVAFRNNEGRTVKHSESATSNIKESVQQHKNILKRKIARRNALKAAATKSNSCNLKTDRKTQLRKSTMLQSQLSDKPSNEINLRSKSKAVEYMEETKGSNKPSAQSNSESENPFLEAAKCSSTGARKKGNTSDPKQSSQDSSNSSSPANLDTSLNKSTVKPVFETKLANESLETTNSLLHNQNVAEKSTPKLNNEDDFHQELFLKEGPPFVLDKPPIVSQTCATGKQKGNKPKKRLNDCIAMLKGKLLDTSVSCLTPEKDTMESDQLIGFCKNSIAGSSSEMSNKISEEKRQTHVEVSCISTAEGNLPEFVETDKSVSQNMQQINHASILKEINDILSRLPEQHRLTVLNALPKVLAKTVEEFKVSVNIAAQNILNQTKIDKTETATQTSIENKLQFDESNSQRSDILLMELNDLKNNAIDLSVNDKLQALRLHQYQPYVQKSDQYTAMNLSKEISSPYIPPRDPPKTAGLRAVRIKSISNKQKYKETDTISNLDTVMMTVNPTTHNTESVNESNSSTSLLPAIQQDEITSTQKTGLDLTKGVENLDVMINTRKTSPSKRNDTKPQTECLASSSRSLSYISETGVCKTFNIDYNIFDRHSYQTFVSSQNNNEDVLDLSNASQTKATKQDSYDVTNEDGILNLSCAKSKILTLEDDRSFPVEKIESQQKHENILISEENRKTESAEEKICLVKGAKTSTSSPKVAKNLKRKTEKRTKKRCYEEINSSHNIEFKASHENRSDKRSSSKEINPELQSEAVQADIDDVTMKSLSGSGINNKPLTADSISMDTRTTFGENQISDIEIDSLSNLRRSKRGKSDAAKIEAGPDSAAAKNVSPGISKSSVLGLPFTKKRLIFSKMLDEEITQRKLRGRVNSPKHIMEDLNVTLEEKTSVPKTETQSKTKTCRTKILRKKTSKRINKTKSPIKAVMTRSREINLLSDLKPPSHAKLVEEQPANLAKQDSIIMQESNENLTYDLSDTYDDEYLSSDEKKHFLSVDLQLLKNDRSKKSKYILRSKTSTASSVQSENLTPEPESLLNNSVSANQDVKNNLQIRANDQSPELFETKIQHSYVDIRDKVESEEGLKECASVSELCPDDSHKNLNDAANVNFYKNLQDNNSLTRKLKTPDNRKCKSRRSYRTREVKKCQKIKELKTALRRPKTPLSDLISQEVTSASGVHDKSKEYNAEEIIHIESELPSAVPLLSLDKENSKKRVKLHKKPPQPLIYDSDESKSKPPPYVINKCSDLLLQKLPMTVKTKECLPVTETQKGFKNDPGNDTDSSSQSDVPLKQLAKKKDTTLKPSENEESRLDYVGKTARNERMKKKMHKITEVKKVDLDNDSTIFCDNSFEKKPRKSNILASQKIYETFKLVASEEETVAKIRIDKSGVNSLKRKCISKNEKSKKVKVFKKGKRRRKIVQNVSCDVCLKNFRRFDNYLRHSLQVEHLNNLTESNEYTFSYIFGNAEYINEMPQADKPTTAELPPNAAQMVEKKTKVSEHASDKTCTQLGLEDAAENRINLLALAVDEVEKQEFHKIEFQRTEGYKYSEVPCNKDAISSEESPTKKIRNTDEALFYECCELLKEANNESKKNENIVCKSPSNEAEANKCDTKSDEKPTHSKQIHQETSCSDKLKFSDDQEIFEDKFDKIKRKCRKQAVSMKSVPKDEAAIAKSFKTRKKHRNKPHVKRSNIKTGKILTKGALKGYDEIKESADYLNMPTLFDIKTHAGRNKQRNKRAHMKRSETTKKDTKKQSNPSQSSLDIYEFNDNDDSDFMDFKKQTFCIKSKISNAKDMSADERGARSSDCPSSISDTDDFVYMSDYACSGEEGDNSQMSLEVEHKIKFVDKKEVSEKNTVMGKIFKNKISNKKKNRTSHRANSNVRNLDLLFDSLLENNEKIKCNTDNKSEHKGNESPQSAHSHKASTSNHFPDFILEENISENEDSGGVAKWRTRRKCTVGKQNVLAENWSSESESDLLGSVPMECKRKKKKSGRKQMVPKEALPPVLSPDVSDGEHTLVEQHGWIVGDSHKKLVTMLAHAKGRKRNH